MSDAEQRAAEVIRGFFHDQQVVTNLSRTLAGKPNPLVRDGEEIDVGQAAQRDANTEMLMGRLAGLLVDDDTARLVEAGKLWEAMQAQLDDLTDGVTDEQVAEMRAHFAEHARLVNIGRAVERLRHALALGRDWNDCIARIYWEAGVEA